MTHPAVVFKIYACWSSYIFLKKVSYAVLIKINWRETHYFNYIFLYFVRQYIFIRSVFFKYDYSYAFRNTPQNSLLLSFFFFNLTSIITTHTHKLRLTFNDHCLSDHTNHHILYYLPYDAYFSSHLLRTVYLTYSSMAYIYQNVFDVDYVLFFH